MGRYTCGRVGRILVETLRTHPTAITTKPIPTASPDFSTTLSTRPCVRTRRSGCLRRHRWVRPTPLPIRAAAHNGRLCGWIDVRCAVAVPGVVSHPSSPCHTVTLVKEQYVVQKRTYVLVRFMRDRSLPFSGASFPCATPSLTVTRETLCSCLFLLRDRVRVFGGHQKRP